MAFGRADSSGLFPLFASAVANSCTGDSHFTRVCGLSRCHRRGHNFSGSGLAGYDWFTDWGRDTMISLEGLTLTTGRYSEGAWILRTFAQYIRDGLIPNLFPEGRREGLYHTADATLWFFHAVHRYTQASGDRSVLQMVLPQTPRYLRVAYSRDTVWYSRRSRGWFALSRGRWICAHVDGCQGRGLGGHPAAGKSG